MIPEDRLTQGFEISGEFGDRASLMAALESLRVTHDHRPDQDDPFRSWIQRRRFGGVIFSEMGVDPCVSYRRDSAKIESDEYVCITAQTMGQQQFVQPHADIDSQMGDVFIWSAQAPSRSICNETAAVKTLMVPIALAERRIGNVGDLYGRKAGRDERMTNLIFSHLLNLHQSVDFAPSEKLIDIIIATLELLRSCLPDIGEACQGTNYQKELFGRCATFIRANLTEESLSITSVANHIGISTRSLQQLFTLSDTTFGTYVRKGRLTLASQALAVPAFVKVSVTEVAHRFGFYDLAHFSRTFKNEFGCSPTDFRRRRNA